MKARSRIVLTVIVLFILLFGAVGLCACSGEKTITVTLHAVNNDFINDWYEVEYPFTECAYGGYAQYDEGQNFYEKKYETEDGTEYSYNDRRYRDGYDCIGLYDAQEGGNMIVDADGKILSTLTDGMHLYSRYTPNDYTFTFETGLGTIEGAEEVKMTYDTTITKPFPVPKSPYEKYRFVGYKNKRDKMVTDASGTPLADAQVFHVRSYPLKPVLYAVYEGDDVSVKLSADGEIIGTKTVEFGTPFELDVPTAPSGYAFTGWCADRDCNDRITGKDGVSQDIWTIDATETTVYAKFSPRKLVSIEIKCGDDFRSWGKECYVGEEVTLTAEEMEGRDFIGWFVDGEKVETEREYTFTVTPETRVEQRYEYKTYTVTLDPHGGVCEEESVTVTYKAERVVLPYPYKDYGRFLGWYSGETKMTDEKGRVLFTRWNIAEDTTLWAKYEITDYKAITSQYQFRDWTTQKPSGHDSDHYILINDIDFTGVTLNISQFSGIIDGDGHKLTGVKLESTAKSLGMFSKVTGTIKNLDVTLEVKSTSVELDGVYVGGICGELSGVLDNVTVRGKVTGSCGTFGGLVGKMTGGAVKNCTNYATVAPEHPIDSVIVGGVVGYAADGSIDGDVNYGAVTAKNRVGGIVGYAENYEIKSSTNKGEITGEDYVGGVIGKFYREFVNDFTALRNEGGVTGDGNVGGVIGYCDFYYYTSNSDTYTIGFDDISNSGTVTGNSKVGGIGGYMSARGHAQWGHEPKLRYGATNVTNSGNVTASDTHAGGIFGYITTDAVSRLSDSSSSCEVTGSAYVGGLVGQAVRCEIVDCDNAGSTVTATSYKVSGNEHHAYLGGYVGLGHYVEGCTNGANVTYGENGRFVGGVAGALENNDYASSGLKNCTNKGNITAKNAKYVGGIVGYFHNEFVSDFTALKNEGEVIGADYVGGVMGYCDYYYYTSDSRTYAIRLYNVSNGGTVTGNSQVGGIAGYMNARGHAQWGHYPEMRFDCTYLSNSGNVTAKTVAGGFFGTLKSDASEKSKLTDCACSGAITADTTVGSVIAVNQNCVIESCEDTAVVTENNPAPQQ